jgi:hypothetical protein
MHDGLKDVPQWLEPLPNMCEALGLLPSTKLKKKREGKMTGGVAQ